MRVEKVELNSYRITCRVKYFDTSEYDTYLINLVGGGTGEVETFPYGGNVSPPSPTLQVTGPDWEMVAELKKRSLVATLTFHYNLPPSPGATTHCWGGAVDQSNGQPLGEWQMYDQIRD